MVSYMGGAEMSSQENSESTLLTVMNSAPFVDGVLTDQLSDPSHALGIVKSLGGDGSGLQVDKLRGARNALSAVVRGKSAARVLSPYLSNIVSRPSIVDGEIAWELEGASDDIPAARLVLAWSEVTTNMPGRLRPCANPECSKFLIDRSKPNTARWCSMATCGNRLKARRHQARQARTA